MGRGGFVLSLLCRLENQIVKEPSVLGRRNYARLDPFSGRTRGCRSMNATRCNGMAPIASSRFFPLGVRDQRGFGKLALVEPPGKCQASLASTQPRRQRREDYGACRVIHGCRNPYALVRRHASITLVHHGLKFRRSVIHCSSSARASATPSRAAQRAR